jgi:hypothetical protein
MMATFRAFCFGDTMGQYSPRQVVRTSHLFRVAGRVAILKRPQSTKVHHGSISLKLC